MSREELMEERTVLSGERRWCPKCGQELFNYIGLDVGPGLAKGEEGHVWLTCEEAIALRDEDAQ